MTNKILSHNLIKTHVGLSIFYTYDLPWCVLTFIQQIRTNQPIIKIHNSTVYLNAMKLKWNNLKIMNEFCKNCNDKKIENIFHVICECDCYILPRIKYIGYLNNFIMTEHNFLQNIFSIANFNRNTAKNLYFFWIEAMKLRNI